MKKRIKKIITIFMSVLLVIAVCTACAKQSTSETEQTTSASAEVLSLSTESDVTVSEDASTLITLNNNDVKVSGSGVTVTENTILITEGGTYTVTGTLTDGRIVVDADDAEVTIVLNGASITCSDSSAIYVYNADLTTIYLKEGTENTLADGNSYSYNDSYSSQADEEPNACLYAKDDLVIAGSGTLIVKGNFNNGITGNDTLKIENCTLTLSAKNNGINGKDNLTVKKATVTVKAGGDALRSTNDTDSSLGYMIILSSKLKLTSGEDGLQAETYISIQASTFSITSGGGSSKTVSDNVSAKGVKAGTDITISGGKITIDSADDAIHADNDVTIESGTLTLTTSDDGIHADYHLTINGGTIRIEAHEGLEGTLVTLNDGTISIDASDDGINGAQKINGVTPTVEINGGKLTINMGQGDTDAIDSNGNLYINGGIINITAQSPFDYDGTGELNGGTVTVNGEKVTELTNQFADGMGGMQGGLGGMQGGMGGRP